MNYLIISCHPYEGSFAAGVAENIKEALQSKGKNVTHIDLIADGFNHVMDKEDLSLWRQGGFKDSLVGKYMDAIKNADILIMPFPIWWGTMPAILKGFIDKVFLPGFTYTHGENGQLIGLMPDKKAVLITTMETPERVFNNYYGNPIESALIKDTLQTCGIEVEKHFVIDNILSGGKENAEKRMNEIVSYFS